MFKLNLYMIHQAKVFGGLHGRVSGSIGGIVYSAARTRQGKVVTAREWVMPGEITDSKVIAQRLIFKQALYAVRYLGAGLWQADFNRGIGQLPGFHSMMSIVLKASDRDTLEMEPPPDTPLGSLYSPLITMETHGSVAGSVTATWGGGLGPNGTDADVLNVFGIERDGTEEGVRGGLDFAATAVRSDLTLDIATGSSGTHWVIGAYFQGAGIAEGNLSRCQYVAVQSNPPD